MRAENRARYTGDVCGVAATWAERFSSRCKQQMLGAVGAPATMQHQVVGGLCEWLKRREGPVVPACTLGTLKAGVTGSHDHANRSLDLRRAPVRFPHCVTDILAHWTEQKP